MENPGLGGGRCKSKSLPWWGYGYFLEPHICTVYKCDTNIFLKNVTHDVSFRTWNEVPYFKQGGEEKVFWFKQDGSTPLPKLPFRVPPLPHHPLPQGIYFNITRPNILYAVIKFWLWQNYQIIQNDLPKLAIGTWISDFWNPHIMKFELIGSSNLYNKIKAHKCQDKEQFSFSYIHLLLLL